MCRGFEDTSRRYWNSLNDLGNRLIRLLALCLNLEKDFFAKHFTKSMALVRLLHYNSVVSAPEKGVFACGMDKITFDTFCYVPGKNRSRHLNFGDFSAC